MVDAEYDDVVGLLVLREEKRAGGVDLEAAGFLASGGNTSDWRQRSLPSVDRIDGDGIFAAVGGVQEFAGGMHLNFSVVVSALEIFGQSRDGL